MMAGTAEARKGHGHVAGTSVMPAGAAVTGAVALVSFLTAAPTSGHSAQKPPRLPTVRRSPGPVLSSCLRAPARLLSETLGFSLLPTATAALGRASFPLSSWAAVTPMVFGRPLPSLLPTSPLSCLKICASFMFLFSFFLRFSSFI